MPAPTPQRVIEQIRELISRGLGVRASGRKVGVSEATASRVKNGQRHAKPAPRQCVKLCSLGLTDGKGKLCRKCGDPMRVKTFTGRCIECEVLQLASQGKIEIAEAG
jgi:hypothetical protein